MDYLTRILTAQVYDVAVESPLEEAPGLSARTGNRVLLKREDLQPVFSFKLRGAYNRMAGADLSQGAVAASAGNHAQGVALAAQKLGCRATIVMPVTTPRIKVAAVEARGAAVILDGESYDDAQARARTLPGVFIHPYDDPAIIAGQGTIGMEMLRQQPRGLHAIFAPVGGGGLIAGIAAYVKRLAPAVRVIGVEPADADAMRQSLLAGRRVRLEQVGLFADGVAVKEVGEETFRLCRELVDEVVVADTDEICAAIKDVFEDTRTILEPAGALAVAGLKAYAAREGLEGRTLAAIASGANMNFDRLRFVAERAELGEEREAVFAATIPERVGSFKEFCARLGPRQVTEFNYRYGGGEEAHVFVGVEVASRAEADALLGQLEAAGIRVLDLSHDETAKLHIRHLVGGRASAPHERLLRFEFPERPGALMRFLDRMSAGWNISLFHYRNHGADYGRVLAGIQVPPEDEGEFRAFLAGLGYPALEETQNPAYRMFLA